MPFNQIMDKIILCATREFEAAFHATLGDMAQQSSSISEIFCAFVKV